MKIQGKFYRIVWFRNDLRVHDNPALFHAAEDQQGVLAVYFICRDMLQNHCVAPARIDFIRRHLLLLKSDLAALNIPLLVINLDSALEIIPHFQQLIKTHHIEELFFNAEYPWDEFNRDKQVSEALRTDAVKVKRFHDRVIIPPGMIRNGKDEPYKVFTAFKNNWLKQARVLQLQPLKKPKRQPEQPIVVMSDKALNDLFKGLDLRDLSALWPAGEKEASSRLKQFIKQHIADYHVDRDFPDLEGTSQLSPYLAIGSISPRQCIAAALQANQGELDSGNPGVTTWIGELIWRDFYQHVVVDFPYVCKFKAMQKHTEAFPWRYDHTLFKAWCDGETGIPIVDAAMLQLKKTGWMHNRLRMVVAMFLTKNLQIDWRMGERYFMSELIDGDFAANNGGWQWSASTGTDAAPYFRIFNPVSQSQRFDVEGAFIKTYLPALAKVPSKVIHNPPPTPGYPLPIVNLSLSRKETIALFSALKP
ncbi:deoxyribodipyrimidine photo-lyase [Cellvibrio zantedeschiae]|uniref:Deoxyribodipyrimidine photo-lyase n=1 Tax=Cellvibrio zantedeschiae TaxID=1237077 RepID=A0ABQ3B289_9GAMM|nr:deoxyribodipyrimidine photo-lyase [Cellvibrio zantedeschiae]GGY71344.1 deoxyribodipyrimidine photo-lyase [Cellvibrio zantedeschiae]